MARTAAYLLVSILAIPALVLACSSSQQDQSDRRRVLAEQNCEDAILGQLSSRATAQFDPDSEHVYYDSAGGAAVSGTVMAVGTPRKFACILKPATESTWVLSGARFLN